MKPAAHELIDRYLYDVARHLPVAQRDDVVAELRSLLLDGLEDCGAEGLDQDRQVVELLQRMGPARQVAERYAAAAPSLIGPHLFPAFRRAAGITFTVLACVVVFLPALSLLGSAMGGVTAWSPSWAAEWAWMFLQSAVFSLGLLVLVFALAERVMARRSRPGALQPPPAFDPRTLPPVPQRKDPDRISPGGMVATLYVLTALFTLLNFFPRWMGLYFCSRTEIGGEVMVTAGAIPISALGIHIPLLAFDVWCLLAMAVNVAVLRQGRWQPLTRWTSFGTRLAGAGVLMMTLASSRLGQYDAVWIHAKYPEIEPAAPFLSWILALVLAGMLGATLLVGVVKLYKWGRSPGGLVAPTLYVTGR